MPIYRLTLYAGIALLSVGILLFFFDNPRDILGSIDFETQQNIEAFAVANNASTKYFDENGELSYTFQSKKLSHFLSPDKPEDNYTSAEAPNIVVFGDDKPWYLQADKARVSANQVITLSNNVSFEHVGVDNELIEMFTDELIIDTVNKLAYTTKAVTILSAHGELSAVGMEADLSQRKIKLLSKVKGRHRPQKFN